MQISLMLEKLSYYIILHYILIFIFFFYIFLVGVDVMKTTYPGKFPFHKLDHGAVVSFQYVLFQENLLFIKITCMSLL